MKETIISTVKAFRAGKRGKVVTVPAAIRKYLGENKTEFFLVKIDSKNRMIFEPLEKAGTNIDGKQ